MVRAQVFSFSSILFEASLPSQRCAAKDFEAKDFEEKKGSFEEKGGLRAGDPIGNGGFL